MFQTMIVCPVVNLETVQQLVVLVCHNCLHSSVFYIRVYAGLRQIIFSCALEQGSMPPQTIVTSSVPDEALPPIQSLACQVFDNLGQPVIWYTNIYPQIFRS